MTNDGGTCTCRPLYPNCSLFRTEMLGGIGLYGASRSAGGYLSVVDSPSLCTVLQLLYRIAGNFRGRKLSRIGEKYDCSLLLCQRTPHPPILWRKLSQITTKPRNSQKFSPSKVFRYTVVFVGVLECWMHFSVTTVCVLSFALYIPCCIILITVVGGMWKVVCVSLWTGFSVTQ